VLFCLALVALFAWTLATAQGFRAQARLFPTIIAAVGLGFALLQLVLEVRKTVVTPTGAEPAVQFVPPAVPFVPIEEDEDAGTATPELPPNVRRQRTLAILGWVLIFAGAAWLIGFTPSVLLCVLAYLRIDARESWRTSIIYAVACGGIFYGLFERAIRIPFEEGFLVTLLLDNLAL
jgi:hypothetical protein